MYGIRQTDRLPLLVHHLQLLHLLLVHHLQLLHHLQVLQGLLQLDLHQVLQGILQHDLHQVLLLHHPLQDLLQHEHLLQGLLQHEHLLQGHPLFLQEPGLQLLKEPGNGSILTVATKQMEMEKLALLALLTTKMAFVLTVGL